MARIIIQLKAYFKRALDLASEEDGQCDAGIIWLLAQLAAIAVTLHSLEPTTATTRL
jgi:hypothetical protein